MDPVLNPVVDQVLDRARDQVFDAEIWSGISVESKDASSLVGSGKYSGWVLRFILERSLLWRILEMILGWIVGSILRRIRLCRHLRRILEKILWSDSKVLIFQMAFNGVWGRIRIC